MDTIETWQWAVGQLVVAAAIWGGIRVDIRNIHKRLDNVEGAVKDVHGRVDRWYENHNHNGG